MQRRQRGINTGLLLLFYEISRVGFENIPPVTLGILALNIILFLNPLGPLSEVCISVNESFYRKNWQRLLLSPIHHADDWHLYFNMVSMLWKGIMLERKLGSIWLAYIIAVFSVLIGVVYMVLEYTLAEILDDPTYKMSCAVGFSGVLFALKVLNNHYNPGRFSSVLGMQISSKYVCWVELVAIHLISPGASFAGHLAGILVGMMYTVGPLEKIMKACAGGFSSFTNPARQRDYYSHFGGATHNNVRRPYGFWLPPEQLSEEEMRRQRLRRFERR
ncbi:rhomboid-related protein 4 isoform X2 [Dromaius novaehollandiae]|uniref:rhomboid-related protein 4 isoform X2 n=1 Tax=Dromaius novaehollandiae TaxID=8790 RepID=UPI000E1EFC1B|nr:rhomboid-related protein 4 isoform X2 [Dromaius novaehollandiae]